MGRGGNLKILNEPFYPIPYYAVGDLYLTTNSENPNIRFGYGTWSLFGEGRTLVCVDTSDSDFNTVKKTGGEKTHTLTINEMPSHNHSLPWATQSQFGFSYARIISSSLNNVTEQLTNDSMYNTGGNQPHNNLQPFITCYVWLRTA